MDVDRPRSLCVRTLFLVLTTLIVGCRSPAGSITPNHTPGLLVTESFEDFDAATRYWSIDSPQVQGVEMHFARAGGDGFMSMALTASSGMRELSAHRVVDLTAVRGQRVRLSGRVRMPKMERGFAYLRLSAPSMLSEPMYTDFTASGPASSESWTTLHAVVDVSHTASRGEIALILSGPGIAWFDDVRLVSLGPSPRPVAESLSPLHKEHISTLSQALALVRYFHPSDQSASLDWDSFTVRAIDELLHLNSELPFERFLERLFARVAPTVRFVQARSATGLALPRDPDATHLVRWHHLGLGSSAPNSQYVKFRDGINDEESAFTYVYTIASLPHLETCRTADIRARVRVISEAGSAFVFAELMQPAQAKSYIREPITAKQVSDVVVRGEVPDDVHQLRLGVYLIGRSSVELTNLSLTCFDGRTVLVDAHSTWFLSRDDLLYRKEVIPCGAGTCLAAYRIAPETEFRPERDVANIDIGSGLHMLLPIAVWSDGKRTFPRRTVSDEPPPKFAIGDLPVRLAAAVTTWSTLLWFYPYFRDQQIDWPAVLPRALDEVTMANSPEATHAALSRLVSELHDGHARVRHPTQSMLGILPISLRTFGKGTFVVGALPQYLTSIPIGSEVITMDGIPVGAAYASTYRAVSAATVAFRDYLASLYLTVGRIGSLRHVRLRTPKGEDLDLVLPLVSRDVFFDDIREIRPKSGSEIKPSVFYVDAATLDRAKVLPLISSLRRARTVILDMRGAFDNGVFEFLAHFIEHEVRSPGLEIPIVSVQANGGPQDIGWLLWPAAPLLTCHLIVLSDVRAVSAIETALQIIRDNHLGTLVGETSAGTNGDVNTFSVSGGFEVRFTGLRVSSPDGSTIQGHGITPDLIVHPTIGGIRAGVDEVLEAAVTLAQAPKSN